MVELNADRLCAGWYCSPLEPRPVVAMLIAGQLDHCGQPLTPVELAAILEVARLGWWFDGVCLHSTTHPISVSVITYGIPGATRNAQTLHACVSGLACAIRRHTPPGNAPRATQKRATRKRTPPPPPAATDAATATPVATASGPTQTTMDLD